jgi:hypothetical protein
MPKNIGGNPRWPVPFGTAKRAIPTFRETDGRDLAGRVVGDFDLDGASEL